MLDAFLESVVNRVDLRAIFAARYAHVEQRFKARWKDQESWRSGKREAVTIADRYTRLLVGRPRGMAR
jgi:anti-sigma-K factor RskA